MPKKAVSSKKISRKLSARRTPAMKMKTVTYENGVEEFFVKSMPSLPDGLKEFIVSVGPWIVLVMVLLMLPAVLAVLGLGTMMMPFAYMMGSRWGYKGMWFLSLISFGLSVWALPGLFRRQLSAWRLILYSSVVNAVGSLLNGELVSMIVGLAISLYVLYQVKSYYK